MTQKATTRSRLESWFAPLNLKYLFEEKVLRSKAVGRDGVRVTAFASHIDREILLIGAKVRQGTYRFTKYKARLVSKGPSKAPRLLAIPTVRDRLTLRALCEFLAGAYPDAEMDKPHVYIKKIKNLVNEKGDEYAFVKADIEDYYGSIDRKLLMRTIRRRIRVKEATRLIESAISTPALSEDTGRGIPQGLSISNILASIYLKDVDDRMREKWLYHRYVDDILMVVPAEQASEALEELSAHLRKRKLKVHPLSTEGKTKISPLSKGIDYLGFELSSRGVSIRQSSYKKMFATVSAVFTQAKYGKKEAQFVWRLNLKITGCRLNNKQYGWVAFFRQSEDKKQFSRLDFFVHQQLKKYRLMHLKPQIKTFIRAYHEIRHELDATNYIPNFDDYDIPEMKAYLKSVLGLSISGWSDAQIEREFLRAVDREASRLEKDLFEFFS